MYINNLSISTNKTHNALSEIGDNCICTVAVIIKQYSAYETIDKNTFNVM